MAIGKTGVALLTAFALCAATTITPVYAGDYHRGSGGYHKGHGGYHKGHGGYHKGKKGYHKGGKGYHKGHGGYHKGHHHKRKKDKDWVPFAVIGGIAAIAIIASQANKKKKRHHDDGYYSDYDHGGYHKGNSGYHKSGGKYHKASSGSDNCHIVYKTERVRGRTVKKGCTLCYNPDGSAYIVEGSEFVVGYVD